MKRSITALGTGAADATEYYQTSFFVSDENTNMLIDTGGGSGLLTNLKRTNIALSDIQNVFITHRHIDHIFGLFWLLRFRGSQISKGKAPGLTIFASERDIQFIKEFSQNLLKKKVTDLFDKEISFIPVNRNMQNKIGSWDVRFFDCASDKEEQYGAKIQFPDKTTLVFLGDEPYKDQLKEYCLNTDILFHDAFCLERDRAQFTPEKIHHSTVKDATQHAEELHVKTLILFHTEDSATLGERKKLYQEEAQQFYSGEIFVPNDLETINF